MKPKAIVLPRDTVRSLCPNFAQKVISRAVTLTLREDGGVSVEPGKLADLQAELAAKFTKGQAPALSFQHDEKETAQAFLYRVCFGEWPAGYEQGDEDERLATLEHSNSIRGVEIFATGTHNGDEYTEKDLDDMVEAFKALDYRPALKVGHTKDKPGAPAYGWVANLRRIGAKLVADFEAMHDNVFEAIRSKAYDRVSSEVYFNFKRGEKTFRRALKAVALLGAEVPAVANLTPLHKMEFAEFDALEKTAAFDSKLEVGQQAILDALVQRVSDVTKLMKEFDMSKNTAKLATLQTQVAEFGKKMDELKKGGKKPEDQEYKDLQAQIERVQAEIKTLSEQDKDSEETERLRQQVSELQADKRAREIKERCAALKVPAFRPAIHALYSYLLEKGAGEKVKIYSLPDKDGKVTTSEKTLVEAVDAIVSEINGQADRLFKAHAAPGSARRSEGGEHDDDPGVEVDRLALELQRKQPTVYKTYDAALDAVLADNEELAGKYREQQNAGRASRH